MTTKNSDISYSGLSGVEITGDVETFIPKKSNPGLSFLLKELGDDDNFQLVCQALTHKDEEISIGASLALGHMRDLRALPYLLRALLTTHTRKAQAVMWALGEIGHESAVPFLLTALQGQFVPKSAMLALGKIGAPVTAEAILHSLKDSDESLRILAAKALGQIRFGNDMKLIAKTSHVIKTRLLLENSRRVKLVLSVLKSRLEKILEQ